MSKLKKGDKVIVPGTILDGPDRAGDYYIDTDSGWTTLWVNKDDIKPDHPYLEQKYEILLKAVKDIEELCCLDRQYCIAEKALKDIKLFLVEQKK